MFLGHGLISEGVLPGGLSEESWAAGSNAAPAAAGPWFLAGAVIAVFVGRPSLAAPCPASPPANLLECPVLPAGLVLELPGAICVLEGCVLLPPAGPLLRGFALLCPAWRLPPLSFAAATMMLRLLMGPQVGACGPDAWPPSRQSLHSGACGPGGMVLEHPAALRHAGAETHVPGMAADHMLVTVA